jgi:hypothetical protein
MSGVPSMARDARAWLLHWLRPQPFVPGRLVLALAVWPLLLFAFFALPAVGYVNVPPLFAKSAGPPPAANGNGERPAQAITAAPRRLAVLVLPMEQDSSVFDAARDRNIDLIRERVGTNLLVAAGYLADAHYVPDETGYPPRPYFVLQPHYIPTDCAAGYEATLPESMKDQDIVRRVPNLAMAIVAIEKFNRTVLHRHAERTYATIHRWTFGSLPDLSFGPAQVRLSTLRRIAAERPDWPTAASWASLSDQQLLDKVEQECEALKIASTIVLHGLAQPPQPGCSGAACVNSEEAVIGAYAGRRPRRKNAPIDYVGLVQAMTRMMEAQLPETPR